jgi:hypothetical protein
MSGTLWIGPPGWHDNVEGRWLNSYVWTVPGEDPAAPPGEPRADEDNYIWATVSNSHDAEPAIGALVDFYFCHYGSAPQRSARIVGTSRVDVAPRSSETVLCVVPLRERTDGCLQVVVRHPLDALPSDWSPMVDRYWNKLSQVGYRNLHLTGGPPGTLQVRPFEVAAPGSDSTELEVSLVEGFPPGAERERILGQSNLDVALPYDAAVAAYGLSPNGDPDANWRHDQRMAIEIPHGESRIVYIVTETQEGSPAFMGLSAVVRADGKVHGGVSLMVTRK